MTITAKYSFDKKATESMPVTIMLTATLSEWRELQHQLRSVGDNPSRPVEHCVLNIIDAIDIAVGHSYKTHGHSYDPAKPEAAE